MNLNKENLLKLADFLENEIKDEQFDIGVYRGDKYGDSVYFKNTNDCGTMGCALGWAPFVKGLEPLESDFHEGSKGVMVLDYDNYSSRIFGIEELTRQYVFSGQWINTDEETRDATIKRIRNLVAEGELTKDMYSLMIEHEANIC